MIRTVFLTGEYPPMQGGIADHTAHLAKHLTSLQVESSILISHRWKDDTTPNIERSSPSIQTPEVFPTIPNWGWRCWPAVAKFLATHRPDILHIQYQAAAFNLGGWINWLPWYLKKRGVATHVVTTFHDLRIPYIFPKAGSFRRKSVLALARYSDAVICTNREDLHSLNKHFASFDAGHQSKIQDPKPKVHLIPLGSNVEAQPPPGFDRTVWRAKYGVQDSTLLLAYFGFLNESKGGDILIEALARLRRQGIDAQLLLIGGDVGDADPTNVAHAQRIQALVDRLLLTEVVHRTGFVELPEVSANLLAADLMVMPYRDGVSFRRTTLIAALRHGRPVISTSPLDPALLPEIEAGQNMLLVPPDDATALATAIAPLVDDFAVREKLSRGAKQLGNLFEWDQIALDTAALYRTLRSKN